MMFEIVIYEWKKYQFLFYSLQIRSMSLFKLFPNFRYSTLQGRFVGVDLKVRNTVLMKNMPVQAIAMLRYNYLTSPGSAGEASIACTCIRQHDCMVLARALERFFRCRRPGAARPDRRVATLRWQTGLLLCGLLRSPPRTLPRSDR